MSRRVDWRSFTSATGDFELAMYLHRSIYDLMKHALDLGTLLSEDQDRLRAYREQIKNLFKNRWLETAEALHTLGVIVPCGCDPDEFCRICGGARYRLSNSLSADQIQELAMVTAVSVHDDPAIQRKLQVGMERALNEVEMLDDGR